MAHRWYFEIEPLRHKQKKGPMAPFFTLCQIASGLVHSLHTEPDTSLLINFQHLDLNGIAFG